MFASFRYAIRKTVSVKSTWIILAIAAALIIGLAGVLPFSVNFRGYNLDEGRRYVLGMYISYASGVGTILTMVIAIFAGFKGAGMFREEMEDGSLLIMLSKPVSRTALITAKWLAYVAVLLVFSFVISLLHAFGIGIGTQFRAEGISVLKGIFLEFGFAVVFSLIFAGVALFFSTFLSATQTAVTVLVFGILSPLTTAVQPASASPEYQTARSRYGALPSDYMGDFISYRIADPVDRTVRQESGREAVLRIERAALVAADLPNSDPAKQGLFDFLHVLDELTLISGAPDSVGQLSAAYISKTFADFEVTTAASNIRLFNFWTGRLYVPSGETNKYLALRFIDFSAQASALSDFVTDKIFSTQALEDVALATSGRTGTQQQRQAVDVTVTATTVNRLFLSMAAFSKPDTTSAGAPIQLSETERRDAVSSFFTAIGGKAYTIKYVKYINKDYVLIAYVLIAIGVTPVALIILRYKNFR